MEAIARTARLPQPLARIVRERLGDDPLASEVVLDFLCQRGDQGSLARGLCDLAGDAAQGWPLRRAAVLMLEHQLLRLPPDDWHEQRAWIERLGIRGRDLARDGWRGKTPDELASELRARLARLARVHSGIRGLATTARALGDFLHTASKECRLTLGRYLWSADEIVGRIESSVRRSRGVRSGTPDLHPGFEREAEHTLKNILPPLEEAIVRRLGEGAVIRWVAGDTPDDINSLVEYPVGAVVLVVKPPGGHHEIEIKRAGVRAENPLDVVYTRNGWLVASTHHLHGGSGEHSLAYEAASSALLSRLYRAVHGREAPISRTIFTAHIYGVPSRIGEMHALDYFTDPRVFGDDYHPMRQRMQLALAKLASYEGIALEPPLNPIATTGEFFGAVRPGQAIEVGTTSFRLDKLLRHLAPGGAEDFFAKRELPFRGDDARRFADELLDEILCVYEPPRLAWHSHATYVEAAFRVPANRARATGNYFSAMEQVGHFWGTLLGARGSTGGESFVVRNCGLRSVWEDGAWRLRVIFMDHDGLQLTGPNSANFDALSATRGAWKDAKHVLGGRLGTRRIRGEVGFLREIYRASRRVEREGMLRLRAAMKAAYDKTLDAMQTDSRIAPLFHFRFLERLRDWDELVAGWLATGSSRPARRAWRRDAIAALRARDYNEKLIDNHLSAIGRDWRFLRKVAFLFTAGPEQRRGGT